MSDLRVNSVLLQHAHVLSLVKSFAIRRALDPLNVLVILTTDIISGGARIWMAPCRAATSRLYLGKARNQAKPEPNFFEPSRNRAKKFEPSRKSSGNFSRCPSLFKVQVS
jgi:hypothetical protein